LPTLSARETLFEALAAERSRGKGVARQSSLVPKVEEIVNDITRRAGGDVVSGPVLSRGDGADS
jgi:hypothetical protein